MKPFDCAAMRQRREQFFAFACDRAPTVFQPDGRYQPATENDRRIAYWMYPALATGLRDFANICYAAAPSWNEFDVFCTSSVAVNLARHRADMSPALVRQSEEHLAQFVMVDGGRGVCSGCNDYVFQGYNDNMPAMSVRALILTGDLLGRKDCTDRGLFSLEALCAHFERRGLLAEYSSGTYTPIALTSLVDVVELSTNAAAREMATSCANRVLLDVFGHWHQHVGGIGGAQSRAYTADLQQCFSVMNALMWYLTGSPLCVNPLEALRDLPNFPGYVHHGRNFAFNLAQFVEVMTPTYANVVAPGVRQFCAAPPAYPYELIATADAGQSGLLGGGVEIQTRAFHQPLYALGTASHTWFDHSGQQAPLHAVFAAVPQPATWRDRVAVWHKTIAGDLDQGDLLDESGGAHSFAGTAATAPLTETGHVNDVAKYHVLQQRGSALALGVLGPVTLGQELRQLKFSLIFGTFLRMPDEIVAEEPWHFYRFGEVYIGARLSGMVEGRRVIARQVIRNQYLRLELPLLDNQPVTVTQDFREWCDFGYVFEIAARDECGSFAEFRRQCRATTWEFCHAFYRNSRYCGRHGELQIVDSVAAYSCRFMAIDGQVEPRTKFTATGLDPNLTQLFPDGHRVKQRRLLYDPTHAGSPFYPIRAHLVEPPAARGDCE